MIGIDTNVLLRYFTQDDVRQSRAATRFVDEQLSATMPGHVSLVTLAETAWVLGSRYDASQAEVVDLVMQLMSDPRFVVQDQRAAWLALEAVEQTAVDFPDALIAFVNREHGCSHTVTFDQKAARIPSVVLLR